ncbi:thermonuclease family protein [Metamycoplasma hyosynoviae]|uniref:thermonuclease family protein n=1 Tax=Metamycoplasma hyosynoviae TaxID=29559 RepID=UPI00235FA421|nr:thermonuclease family protein [Metamycoplasma hyosynoviae]MDD1373447.1 thermonuclease family protein [Metamycoplasma hyosynoviae]MDD1375557.1 thermonuclease family protein [Metamycoplasma hyosynoviae]MDD1376420.1 thermonuclease family protein [Metamycoplasma hyosynoviae]MDD1376832.1 thermonuclease family protein [Metamycoplasma hyosynoviae]
MNNKFNKKILKFSISPILAMSSLIPLILVSKSCGYDHKSISNADYSKKGYAVQFQNYKNIGEVFDQSVVGGILTENPQNPLDPPVTVEKKFTYWEWFSYVDATVERITDGDTLEIKALTKPFSVTGAVDSSIEVGKTYKVRISTIDTLEEHAPENKAIDKVEKAFAELDHKYAEKLILVGSKVRLVSDSWSVTSYNRKVASLFFGEKYQRNFACEMLAGGYTLPRIQDQRKVFENGYLANGKKDSILALLLPYLAYAYNEGLEQKRGFYSTTEPEVVALKKEHNVKINTVYDLAKLYKEHGDMAGQGEYILSPKYSINPDNKTDNIFRFIKKHGN